MKFLIVVLSLAAAAPQLPDDKVNLGEFRKAFAEAEVPFEALKARRAALLDAKGATDKKLAKLIVEAARQLAEEAAVLDAERVEWLLQGTAIPNQKKGRQSLNAIRSLEEELYDLVEGLPAGDLRKKLRELALRGKKVPFSLRLAVAQGMQADEEMPKDTLSGLKKRKLKDVVLPLAQCEALGEGAADGLPFLSKLTHSEFPLVRKMAVRALGRTRSGAALAPLIGLLDDPITGVRTEAHQTLEAMTGWTIALSEGAWNLWLKKDGQGFVNGTEELQDVIRLLAAEKRAQEIEEDDEEGDEEGAADEDDVDDGEEGDPEELPGESANGDSAEPLGTGEGPSFHGIPLRGERLVFVLDRSGSMNDAVRKDAKIGKHVIGETRWQRARLEMTKTLRSLSPDQSFTIIAFGSTLKLYQPEPILATEENVTTALEWVGDLDMDGATFMYDGLQAAFAMAGRGSEDELFATQVDAVYLLSDGVPTSVAGTSGGSKGESHEILRAIRRWNLLSQVTIHVVGLGNDAPKAFLELLAAQNGGRFVHVVK